MAVVINSFSPNTKAESAKVNENFVNLKNAVDQLQADKIVNTTTDGETVTFDLSVSKIFTVTLGGNRTLAVSNVTVGQSFVVRLVQDSSGSRTVTWWGGIKWPSGTAPTLTVTANSVDAFGFICTAENVYDGYFLGFDLR